MMITMLKTLLLKTGLFEALSSRPDGQPDVLVVVAGETFTGTIQTTRDVEVHGHVAGDIYTPNGRVVVMPDGAVTDGTVWAKNVVWQGAMGGNQVRCSHVEIVPGARSVQDRETPQLFHESMTIGKIGALDVSFSRQRYVVDSPEPEPVDERSIVERTTQELLATS
jgi:cytoskeletal protein CcmA (bactofilin family)